MVALKLIATLFMILVECRLAKFDTVEIKLGKRNVVIPLNGQVKVKRFKPEEFENLKMNIPDLVELVAKVQGCPPPTVLPLLPPRNPLPPDDTNPYQQALRYEPPYPNPSSRINTQHTIPNYSETQLLKNYPNQPPINRHFSGHHQQEKSSKHMLPQLYDPLPYNEYTRPINHPKEAVQSGTQYYPPLHRHPRPQASKTTTVHSTKPDYHTKAIDGVHRYSEDIPRRQSPTFHHTDRRIHEDTKIHLQTKASNNNQGYIASRGSHHELPPNISTWLHDHEILEHIHSEKPAAWSNTRSKNPPPLQGPQQTFVYRDTPAHMSRSTILKISQAPKDKASILERKKVTPRLTSRFKDDKVTSDPKFTVKKKVVKTLEETSKQDLVIPNTSSVFSKEFYATPHSELTFLLHLGDIMASESTIPNPVDQRTGAHSTPDAPTHTSLQDTIVISQKIYSDIKTNAPVLVGDKKTQDTTRHNIETFSPEHNTVPVPKDESEEFQITELKTDIPPLSSSEHGTANNIQEKYTSSELRIEHIKDDPRVEDSTTVIMTSPFFEHYKVANAPQIYNREIFYAQDLTTDVPVIMSSERGETSNIKKIATAPNVIQSVNYMVMNISAQDIRTESLINELTKAASDSLEINTYMSTDAPAFNITLESNTRDPMTNIPFTTSLENDPRPNANEIAINVITITTTSPKYDKTTEALDVASLTVTDAVALNIMTTDFSTSFKSDPHDSVTDAPNTDDKNTYHFERHANVSLNPPALPNKSTKTLAENTITNPEERNTQTKFTTFLLKSTTESAESTKLDAGTNSQNINYSTSTNTPVLNTIAEPYTRDITLEIPATNSPKHNTSNIRHVATNEYVLNETRQLHIRNSQMNTPTSEDDTITDIEDLFTTTETSQGSAERVTMPSSIESMTEMSPTSPMTPESTTMLTPAQSPPPQNEITEIDAVAATKRRACNHARKRTCRRIGKPAATGKRRRRRRRRTTSAPHISYPTSAPGDT